MKSKGIVKSKQEFFYEMDLIDLSEAGAFIERNVWDNFIIKNTGVKIGAINYANN